MCGLFSWQLPRIIRYVTFLNLDFACSTKMNEIFLFLQKTSYVKPSTPSNLYILTNRKDILLAIFFIQFIFGYYTLSTNHTPSFSCFKFFIFSLLHCCWWWSGQIPLIKWISSVLIYGALSSMTVTQANIIMHCHKVLPHHSIRYMCLNFFQIQ